jgi:hypothetical protein
MPLAPRKRQGAHARMCRLACQIHARCILQARGAAPSGARRIELRAQARGRSIGGARALRLLRRRDQLLREAARIRQRCDSAARSCSPLFANLAPIRSVSLSFVYLRLSLALYRAMPSPRVVTVRQRPGMRLQRRARKPAAACKVGARAPPGMPHAHPGERAPWPVERSRAPALGQAPGGRYGQDLLPQAALAGASCRMHPCNLLSPCLKSYLFAGHGQDFP